MKLCTHTETWNRKQQATSNSRELLRDKQQWIRAYLIYFVNFAGLGSKDAEVDDKPESKLSVVRVVIQAGEDVSILGSVGIADVRSVEFHTPETISSHPTRQNTAEDLDDSAEEEQKSAQKIWKRLLHPDMS